MTKPAELREMSDEQIKLVWKDAAESLLRLRIKAQTEKLAAPSEMRKQRRLIARCQTILGERSRVAGESASAVESTANETAPA
jgi:large subunit ribosomal protein L29